MELIRLCLKSNTYTHILDSYRTGLFCRSAFMSSETRASERKSAEWVRIYDKGVKQREPFVSQKFKWRHLVLSAASLPSCIYGCICLRNLLRVNDEWISISNRYPLKESYVRKLAPSSFSYCHRLTECKRTALKRHTYSLAHTIPVKSKHTEENEMTNIVEIETRTLL